MNKGFLFAGKRLTLAPVRFGGMKIAPLVFALGLTTSAHAPAQSKAASPFTPEKCAETFVARLEDARAAVPAHSSYMREHKRIMPWFNAHCRFLTELERTVRKIDELNPFVCDTKKGRPTGLTSELVLAHSMPLDIANLQERATESMMCAKHDPVSLFLRGAPAADSAPDAERLAAAGRILDVLCFRRDTKLCAETRAAQAEALARLAAKESKK